MITFFTTLKPFNDQNRISQINALRSWLNLGSGTEIIIFDTFDEDLDLIFKQNIKHILNVEKFNASIPLPLVSDMFYKTNQLASNPICCYINSDIILTDLFLKIVTKLHNRFNKKYLLVGQRYDFDISELLAFDESWEKSFYNNYSGFFSLHAPYGSDFFVFPKGQYVEGSIPRLVIGRPGWDNWFIYNGVKERNLKVVDITNSVPVFHQNHTQAYNTGNKSDAATSNNLSVISDNRLSDWVLERTNYYIKNGKPKKRKEYKMVYKVLLRIKKLIFNG